MEAVDKGRIAEIESKATGTLLALRSEQVRHTTRLELAAQARSYKK
jgi:hypothetical protein